MLPKLISQRTVRKSPEVAEKVRRMILGNGPEGPVNALWAMASRLDHSKTVEQIDVPTLLLFGEEDAIIDMDTARELARNIRGSKISFFPGAGHLANLEAPVGFTGALLEFLRDLGSDVR